MTTQDPGWSNWSLNQSSHQQPIQPQNEDELRELVLNSEGPLRVVGAGHSFTPIVKTSGTLINLDKLSGLVSADLVNHSAVVKTGSRLKHLSPELEKHGLAFRNLGDINEQSFAGATATATHGTGASLGCLSSEITGVRLMQADGTIVSASQQDNPELLLASQVSLGALGILLEATVNVVPSFKLHRRVWVEPLTEVLAQAQERWDKHHNYEFFYIPFSNYAVNISHDKTGDAITPRPPSEDEQGLAALRKLRNYFKWSRFIRGKLLGMALSRAKTENVIGNSWELLSSVRESRFNEMEYHMPSENALEVFVEVKNFIEKHQREVYFPIEVRKTAGDKSWLSPFQHAARVSLAIHTDYRDDYSWFFSGAEPIFRAAGGRPHWGKLHSLEYADLVDLYPNFSDFTALRKQMDPDGRFMTPELARLWGEAL